MWKQLYYWRPWNVRKLRRLVCLLLEHNVKYGEVWEPDWCDRCWYRDDEINLDELTIPNALHNAYVWLVERDWKWFEYLDMWLITKTKIKLPRWWEY